eukprot:gene9674-9832_t
MALRRGIAGLLRPLLTAEHALAPIAATSHSPLLTPEASSSSSGSYAGCTSFLRRYASEIATTAPSGLSPVDKLSLQPTNMIKYDESNHHRYPPGLDHKSPALLVDLSGIEEGQTVTVKWRGKPVFIRHRTEPEISEAENTDITGFRDPQTDAERVIDPKYLVVIGVCTHLGCVPIAGAGDYNGWFCPCHGTHYDISGRVRKGPAPYNLEVPEYRFITNDHSKAIIG